MREVKIVQMCEFAPELIDKPANEESFVKLFEAAIKYGEENNLRFIQIMSVYGAETVAIYESWDECLSVSTFPEIPFSEMSNEDLKRIENRYNRKLHKHTSHE